jgi:hypothetical protein
MEAIDPTIDLGQDAIGLLITVGLLVYAIKFKSNWATLTVLVLLVISGIDSAVKVTLGGPTVYEALYHLAWVYIAIKVWPATVYVARLIRWQRKMLAWYKVNRPEPNDWERMVEHYRQQQERDQ